MCSVTSVGPCGRQPPSSSVHGILQARVLEWLAIPSSSSSHVRWIYTPPLLRPSHGPFSCRIKFKGLNSSCSPCSSLCCSPLAFLLALESLCSAILSSLSGKFFPKYPSSSLPHLLQMQMPPPGSLPH